jgi:hypothetical protein
MIPIRSFRIPTSSFICYRSRRFFAWRFRSLMASLTIFWRAKPVRGFGDNLPALTAERSALWNSPIDASLRMNRRTPSLTKSTVDVDRFFFVFRFCGREPRCER